MCSNIEGSFTCSCEDGFAGDGSTCTGISSVVMGVLIIKGFAARKLIKN